MLNIDFEGPQYLESCWVNPQQNNILSMPSRNITTEISKLTVVVHLFHLPKARFRKSPFFPEEKKTEKMMLTCVFSKCPSKIPTGFPNCWPFDFPHFMSSQHPNSTARLLLRFLIICCYHGHLATAGITNLNQSVLTCLQSLPT